MINHLRDSAFSNLLTDSSTLINHFNFSFLTLFSLQVSPCIKIQFSTPPEKYKTTELFFFSRFYDSYS